MTTLDRIKKCGIIPVVVLNDANNAVPLAKALNAGGIDVIEVTFRTSAAKASIAKISEELPSTLVGAGTVLTVNQLNDAVEAGAKFIVSPGMDQEIVERALELGVLPLPGAVTPSEIMQGLKLGVSIFKFFPASSFGGIKSIKALTAPFTNAEFVPTGGVTEENLGEYLACEKVIAVGGSWMVKSDLIDQGRFDEISALTAKAIKKFSSLRKSMEE